MTQIAVRGSPKSAHIFHCHSLLLMEKPYLPDVSCLLSLIKGVAYPVYLNLLIKRQKNRCRSNSLHSHESLIISEPL